jgi:hypothetical protein
MGENKDAKEPRPPGAQDKPAGGPKPDAEATSSETLAEIEAAEKVPTGSGADSESSPLETSSPEPNVEGGGRADGRDSGGPM